MLGIEYMNIMDEVTNAEDKLALARMRATRLIETGIWSGLKYSDLGAWIGNFQSQKAKLLASLLLDSFSFKSQEQLASQMEGVQNSVSVKSQVNVSV
jgi:hypothetical protein